MSEDHDHPVRWSVREEGNRVILEWMLRDNYEAIELAEVIAEGIREGELTLEFHNLGVIDGKAA